MYRRARDQTNQCEARLQPIYWTHSAIAFECPASDSLANESLKDHRKAIAEYSHCRIRVTVLRHIYTRLYAYTVYVAIIYCSNNNVFLNQTLS